VVNLIINRETADMLNDMRNGLEGNDAVIRRLLRERVIFHKYIKILSKYVEETEY